MTTMSPHPATDALIERARQLAPVLRERAPAAEALRRLPEETIADAELFLSILVPRKWGGMGLGLEALCEVTRELAQGDASAAWTLAFLIQHSWMACRVATVDAQEELFAERPYIRAAAPLAPSGKARRVDGGFRVSGTFPYASGVWNADWIFMNALVEDEDQRAPHVLLAPVTEVRVNDDWFISGMAATGSSSFTAEDVFVPARMSLPFERFLSADRHRGAEHEEPYLRYPLVAAVDHTSASVALGCAEACVAIGRERLSVSKAFGVPRLERPLSRVRWGTALQKTRCAQLLWRDTLSRATDRSDAGEPWTEEQIGQTGLDCMTVVQLSQEAVGLLCDGMGSSAYQRSDPLQRYRRDVDVVANHRAHDRDTVSDTATRLILGLGGAPADPFAGRAPAAAL